MSIERLLKLSSVLNAGSGTSCTSLTLKQLIKVHESLLDSIQGTGSSICETSGASSSDIDSGVLEIKSMLKRYVPASEVEQCESILYKVNTNSAKSEGCSDSQEALLVIQYLLRQEKGDRTKKTILSGLKNITLPILLSFPGRYDNLLRDAALDASFGMPGSTTLFADVDYSQQLKECLDLIRFSTVKLINTTVQDAKESKSHVDASVISTASETSSCILIRILDIVEEKEISGDGGNSSSMVECHRELVKDVMQDISMAILNAICFYSEDGMSLVVNGKATILMRPVTALLMPSLFNVDSTNDSEMEKESDQMSKMMARLNDLWNFVCSLIDANKNINPEEVDGSTAVTSRRKCRSFEQVGSSVASGLLCSLVDNIHSLPLSIPKHRRSHDSNVEQARIIQHPTFWSFVQKSLTSGDDFNLGIDNVGMKGGAAFTSNMTSSSGTSNASAGHFNPYEDEGAADYDVDQMVRRRAIHILRTVIDREFDIIHKKRREINKGGSKTESPESIELFKKVELWKKYILCFETLEIEVEAHLVDQVYPTVTELCAACVDNGGEDDSLSIPKMTWTWVASIFSRVLLSDSPSLRKLGLYRLLSGKAGISLHDCQVPTPSLDVEGCGAIVDKKITSKASKQRKKESKGKAKAEPAPMYIISPSFILHVLIHSYDSLSTSVGTGINIEGDDGKTSNENLQDLIPSFLTKYTRSLFSDSRKFTNFIDGMLTEKFISSTKARNLVLVSDAVLDAWNETSTKVTLSNETVNGAVTAYRKLFNSGSIVFDYRQSLLLSLSHILSLSNLAANEKPEPLSILKVLSSFPAPDDFTDLNNFHTQTNKNLKIWMESFGETWASNVGAACASAFVRGDLIQFSKVQSDGLIETTALEKEIGSSISKMCALGSESPSSLLWPAINKGLSSTTPFGQQKPPFIKTPESAARSVLLLISGCKERILSGIGHGDLIVDKDGHMLPPPPNIELLISRAVNFALNQLEAVSVCNFSEEVSNEEKCGARSSVSNDFVNNFTFLIDQFRILKKSYPSSVIMVEALGELLKSSTASLLDMDDKLRKKSSSAQDCVKMVKNISVTYAVLSMGATMLGEEANSLTEEQKELHHDLVQLCSRILQMNFKPPPRGSSFTLATWQIKGMRSIFQHAKWGSLMILLPMAYEEKNVSTSILQNFHEDVMEVAMDSVNATPAAALPALFETAVISAKKSFDFVTEDDKKSNMKKVIETFFAIMNDTEQNSTRGYMLSVTCGILFCDRLLTSEFAALENIKAAKGKYSVKKDAPILKAFRKLVKEAGTKKNHILKYAISYISAGWLGDADDKSKIGLSAIPYREDIAKLLIYKEQRSDESNTHQEGLVKQNNDADAQAATLPDGVPRTSVARGFLLVFISQLPDIADISVHVAIELCQYLIFWMLDNVCLDVVEGHLVTGSTEYVQKIRAWQTLCVMSRFVTDDIVSEVMKKVFKAMGQVLHGQIRYFIEVFTIQIANVNPTLFIQLFTKELLRCDISQQHVSSLMIISGNLIVGKDAEIFNKLITSTDETRDAIVLREMIAGVVPWLSSTQGFCRAIAQLLLHKLIPLQGGTSLEGSDAFFLKSISMFLENNPEMTRLRRKQSNFFSEYSIQEACTPEGIFALEEDDVEEANPPHLIEVIKKCLVDIYNEHHPSDVPEWKQLREEIDNLSLNDTVTVGDEEDHTSALVNFQRKILPIDSLNLSLESERQANRNAAGRDRQQLIVCASLIDKVANLAGLTRTAEIFAATRIVVPELKVNKMDNFKSISVGAEEWVDMEECKEGEDLMIFLKKHKDEGYSIIGIEQTSSSTCLSKVKFEEKTVLLLGKEKEGIPVEYLQLVDRCVEIPQFGILRSLNVHVSGAISIWEYTKQRLAKS